MDKLRKPLTPIELKQRAVAKLPEDTTEINGPVNNTWSVTAPGGNVNQPHYTAEIKPGNVLDIRYAYSRKKVDAATAERITYLLERKTGSTYSK